MIKNTGGNLGRMGLLAERTMAYLTKNRYTDKSIQKGFMEKLSGCVEHTEVLYEIIQEAKRNRILILRLQIM